MGRGRYKSCDNRLGSRARADRNYRRECEFDLGLKRIKQTGAMMEAKAESHLPFGVQTGMWKHRGGLLWRLASRVEGARYVNLAARAMQHAHEGRSLLCHAS